VGAKAAAADSFGSAPKEYRYRILHHDTPQCFSVGPDDIYVTTGLLDMIQDEAELALVLAREQYLLRDPNRLASIAGGMKSTYGVITEMWQPKSTMHILRVSVTRYYWGGSASKTGWGDLDHR
jgi:hypothetical protein